MGQLGNNKVLVHSRSEQRVDCKIFMTRSLLALKTNTIVKIHMLSSNYGQTE